MIKVRIALDAFGLGEHIKLLAEIDIWNTGAGTNLRGNYRYIIYDRTNEKTLGEGAIKDWPRTEKTAVELLAAVLRDAGV